MSCVLTLCILLIVARSTYCILNPYPPLDEYIADNDVEQPLFLTNYINLKKFDEAKRLSSVKNKEMNDIAPSFAGYLTVNETFNGNMFFWYFPAALDHCGDAPVVLWLDGGPGDSSLISLFTTNGPFIVNDDLSLSPRKLSWHLEHHLIYIDNPVGAGYSFTDESGYVKNEEEVGRDLYEALRQFFTLFSELQSNQFYITGLSYAGKYIPALGYTILKRSQIPNEYPRINLVGMSIGNGFTDPVNQVNYADYIYQIGLVDTSGHDLVAEISAKGIAYILNQDYESAFNIFYCDLIAELPKLTGLTSTKNFITQAERNKTNFHKFLQLSSTQRAIHIGNNTFHDSSKVAAYLKLDIFESVADLVSELLLHYKIQVYSGQLDIDVPYTSTENYLKRLKFNAAEEFRTAKRTIWRVDDEIAGYIKYAGNLTEVMVRNAGHFVLLDQPKWGLNLLMQLTTGSCIED